MNNPNQHKPPVPSRGNRGIFIYLAVLLALILIASSSFGMKKPESPYQYSEIVAFFDEQKIEKYTFDLGTGELTFTLKGSTKEETYTVPNVNLFVSTVQEQVEEQNRAQTDPANKIPYELIPIQTMPFWVSYLPTLLLIVAMGALWWFTMKQSRGGGNISGFGKAKARTPDQGRKVLFEDVAGADEEKAELVEVVEFLKNPEKFNTLGARIPKGILLVGPPGTGKTLLARAVAGEAHVPFFSISGSEFVEMFVGMGAAKVRDLFKQAGEKAPCIVFIDEIDTIGKKRDSQFGGGNDEREQTLNQLLTEMDGFDGTKGVVILAATNRPESLDPALLRPGRFDRRIPVELPDLAGREAILKVHAAHVQLEEGIDFNVIARATSGASGAELANIVNEAALRAVRMGRGKVSQADLQESVETVIAGYQRKNAVISEHDKRIVAYHEIGHALVAALQSDSAPVQKITIVPRTSGALGYTMQIDESERVLLSQEEAFNKIATFTGGRAAEELIFRSITSGASNDIEQATRLARAMVTRYGMSEKFGMVALEQVQNQYLGGDASLSCSAETAAQIDAEVIALVKKAHDKAVEILRGNMPKLNELAQYLLERESITGEEFMEILKR